MWNPFKKEKKEEDPELAPWRLDYRLACAEYLIEALIEGMGKEQFNRGTELLEEKRRMQKKIIEDNEFRLRDFHG